MKWLDKVIDERLIPIVQRVVPLEIRLRDIDSQHKVLIARLNEAIERFEQVSAKFSIQEKETNEIILKFHEELFSIQRKFNLKVDYTDSDLRSHIEVVVSGLIKHFDQRLDNMGEKKGVVTDLLKKIARLEGQNVQ